MIDEEQFLKKYGEPNLSKNKNDMAVAYSVLHRPRFNDKTEVNINGY